MKKLVLFLLLPALLFAGEIKPKSTIKEVTVYLSGAQVTSEASVNLLQGVNEVFLTDLSPLINQNSIQISGLKDASILSISYSVNYMAKKVDTGIMKELEIDLATLRRNQAILQNKIKGLHEEEALLTTNKKLNGEQQSLTLQQVTTFATYYRERHAQLQTEIYDANVEIGKINQQINDTTLELNKVTNESRQQRGEIIVKIDAPLAMALNLTTKYNVSQAGWFPIYDIKTQGIKDPLSIYYKAHVYQQTGEDWSNVKVTLSTGDPNINSAKPEVLPQYLNFIYAQQATSSALKSYNYKHNPTVKKVSGVVVDETGLPLPGANVAERGTQNYAQTDADGRYSINITSDGGLEFHFVGYKTQHFPVYAQQMNVAMEADTQILESVVVETYRSTGRRNKYSAEEASIAVEEIEDRTATGDVKEMGVTNVVFKITKPYSIPDSQEVTVITIDKFDLPATYEYFTAPLINENVFLTAKVKDWEKFDILPGEANIYFEGSYAGKTFMDPLQTTEELTISLGVDPGVIVERKQIDNIKAKSFLGGTRIVSRNYEISVRNNKAADVNLVLMDRIPVSQNKEIKVEEVQTGGAEYDDKKGLLTWKLNLKPKEAVKKQLSYEVRYPKEKKVNL